MTEMTRMICPTCERTSESGPPSCPAYDCPRGRMLTLLGRGEWVGEIEVLRLVAALPAMAIYEAQRCGVTLFLKLAPADQGQRLKREALFLRQAQANRQAHPAWPVLLPAEAGHSLDDAPYSKVTLHGRLYVFSVLAHVPGETLRERLARHAQPHYEHAGSLILSLADTLYRLHQLGRLHLALQPNIVVVGHDASRNPRPVLLDLGLLARRGAGDLDVASVLPGYQAPELRSGEAIGPQTDVYGLGRLLYEMLDARAAFSAGPMPGRETQKEAFGPQLPNRSDLRTLPSIAMRAIAPDGRHRYADAAALFVALRQTLPPVSPAPRSRWRGVLEMAAFIVGVALTVTALLILL